MQRRLGLDLEVPEGFGVGLAWFTAGEGHFGAIISVPKDGRRRMNLVYRIALRVDDKIALEHIRDSLGVGQVYIRPQKPPKRPLADYIVYRTSDLYHVIVPLFEKYPIPCQFKKATEFEVWKHIVKIHYHAIHSRRWPGGGGSYACSQDHWHQMESLVIQLRECRKFPIHLRF